MTLEVAEIGPDSLDAALSIRRAVFVDEQNVSESEEVDGLDGACRQFLARFDGRAVGTARLKRVAEGLKIQRVAVLKDARGQGVGLALMRFMIDLIAREEPETVLLLDSQTQALAFYARLGFVAEGEAFLDAGIPHRRMSLANGGRAAV